MALLVLRVPQAWLVHQDQPESLDLLENPVFLELLEFLESLVDQERPGRKDHLDPLDLRGAPACPDHLGCLASQESEGCLDYRVCRDSKDRWDLPDRLDLKETKEAKAFPALRVPKE